MLAGSKELICKSNNICKTFGGRIRHAGILTAVGIGSFEKIVDRLTEFHAIAIHLT